VHARLVDLWQDGEARDRGFAAEGGRMLVQVAVEQGDLVALQGEFSVEQTASVVLPQPPLALAIAMMAICSPGQPHKMKRGCSTILTLNILYRST
jgi:hypothetical protein